MKIVYFDPSRDDWAVADNSSEATARLLATEDVHTSNTSVMEYVRVLIAESVLDSKQVEVRFIRSNDKVDIFQFNEYGLITERNWPIGFMEEGSPSLRLIEAQEYKRRRKQKELLEELERNEPLIEMVRNDFKRNPENKIGTIKKVRTRLPDLGLREAKEFVDKEWDELHKATEREVYKKFWLQRS